MFLNVQFNYVMIKTSDKFSIFKIRQQTLTFNTTALTSDYLDQIFEVRLTTVDTKNDQLEARFNITILGSNTMAFDVMRKYESFMQNEPVKFLYNCGEKSLRISIDELFEGDKTVKLVL